MHILMAWNKLQLETRTWRLEQRCGRSEKIKLGPPSHTWLRRDVFVKNLSWSRTFCFMRYLRFEKRMIKGKKCYFIQHQSPKYSRNCSVRRTRSRDVYLNLFRTDSTELGLHHYVPFKPIGEQRVSFVPGTIYCSDQCDRTPGFPLHLFFWPKRREVVTSCRTCVRIPVCQRYD